ncbi:MAG: DUF2442 domain-containing protein [Acidobacteria bacterium]|nr:DUF2442 domain-containing protein [Acidobacteriota bacterium]
MSTLASAAATAAAKQVRVTEDVLTVALADGRVVSVPLSWYPRLADASPRERRAWVLVGPGAGIHWPDIDEDISVEALLCGLPSGESAASLRRWRAARKRPANRALQPTSRRRGDTKSTRPVQAARG